MESKVIKPVTGLDDILVVRHEDKLVGYSVAELRDYLIEKAAAETNPYKWFRTFMVKFANTFSIEVDANSRNDYVFKPQLQTNKDSMEAFNPLELFNRVFIDYIKTPSAQSPGFYFKSRQYITTLYRLNAEFIIDKLITIKGHGRYTLSEGVNKIEIDIAKGKGVLLGKLDSFGIDLYYGNLLYTDQVALRENAVKKSNGVLITETNPIYMGLAYDSVTTTMKTCTVVTTSLDLVNVLNERNTKPKKEPMHEIRVY